METHRRLLHVERMVRDPLEIIDRVKQNRQRMAVPVRHRLLLCHAHENAPPGLDPAAFTSCEVGRDELVPVSAPGPRGKPRFALDGAGARVPMLAYSPESGLGRVLRALLGPALDTAGSEVVFTAHLATVLRSLALQGRGIAFLPGSLVGDDLAAGRLVACGGARWRIPLSVRLFRGRAPMAPLAETFWAAAASAPSAPRPAAAPAAAAPRKARPLRPRNPETDPR